jgi:hypothetical protein
MSDEMKYCPQPLVRSPQKYVRNMSAFETLSETFEVLNFTTPLATVFNSFF